jgi:hypothetical protein
MEFLLRQQATIFFPCRSFGGAPIDDCVEQNNRLDIVRGMQLYDRTYKRDASTVFFVGEEGPIRRHLSGS